MTVRKLLQEMDVVEFQKWMILESNEPWSRRREDINFGRLSQFVIMPHLKPENHPKPESYLPDWWAKRTEPRDPLESFLDQIRARPG